MRDHNDVAQALARQQRYLYITRDAKVLATRLARLKRFRVSIQSRKKAYIRAQNEEKANLWLAVENLCSAIIRCIQMFLDLKAGEPDYAWIRLVEAQNFAHWSCDKNDLLRCVPSEYVSYFDALQKILFPPQMFTSLSATVTSKCSICDSPMSKCSHIRGNTYMGKQCAEMITSMSPNHVAIVDHPEDKKSRITHYGSSRKKMTNVMTLRVRPTGRGQRT